MVAGSGRFANLENDSAKRPDARDGGANAENDSARGERQCERRGPWHPLSRHGGRSQSSDDRTKFGRKAPHGSEEGATFRRL